MIAEEISNLILDKQIGHYTLNYLINGGPRRNVEIHIFDAGISSSNFKTTCKAVRVPNNDDDLMGCMRKRFELASKSLEECILPPVQCFKDQQFRYFCYKDYDNNIHNLYATRDYDGLKKASRGFVVGLWKIHQSRQTHGNITGFNLVTRNGEGYLGGSVGPTLSETVIRGEWGSVVVPSPYTEDILNLAGVLASCLDHNFPLELKLFTDYLNYYRTLDSISHHPYLSSSIGMREFYVALQQVFADLDHSKLALEFKWVKLRTGYHPSRHWRRDVRQLKDRILIDVLDFEGSNYTDTDAAKVKFCRNVWVHGTKGPQSSTKEHCDHINKVLEGLWPGFSCLVYEVACQGNLVRRMF